MSDNDCGLLAVVDQNQMVGAKRLSACDIKVGSCISGELYTCSPDDSIKDALGIMRRKQVRRLVVMELEGLLRGIISVSDVVLSAEKGEGSESPAISSEEIVETYKAICEPNGLIHGKTVPLQAAVA
jgi:CBS domain-containing protein